MKAQFKLFRVVPALLAVTVLAACGGGTPDSAGTSGATTSASTTEAAPGGAQTEVTVWGWDPTLEAMVPPFEAANPDVKVTIQNVGTNRAEYTKLTNAIAAGSGLPDLAQVEYYAIPQYAIPGSLVDLAQFGAGDAGDKFSSGPWNAVTMGGSGKVYGMPLDAGPMALFYDKATFDKAGITTPPTTWDEYYQDAKKIRALGADYYITNDTGSDGGFATSMMWLAGGKPFQVDGQTVTINLTADPGVKTFADFWQKMISEDLVNTKLASWSDEWFKGLSDGTNASLITGAWMGLNLEKSAPGGSGNWRVALTPTPDGKTANAEHGGSSLAMFTTDEAKQAAAWKFLEFAGTGDGVKIRLDQGNFPSTVADLNDPAFLDYSDDYFGGQKWQGVLAEGAKNVLPGWSYPPFEVYAVSIYGDKVKDFYAGTGTYADALQSWQDELTTYAKQNGFAG